ncbi:MAG TPA: phosphate ABC transporter substrate-binding protein PstS [Candidatus Sulfotelmatobacter sp.]|jgi:phosphate transport system substrate-binding protein|nr:phosphate ABC transporter substrate-binding protein PstS [Candidatus Sulfotelmatobacter sp.]
MASPGRKMAVWPVVALFIFGFSLIANSQNIIALVGSGSNLPTPLYSHWVEEYNKLSPGVQVRYLSTGTVKGMEDISRGVGDFAAGEVPMNDEELKTAKFPILHIPTVLVAIVPIYHVPGVKGNLRFSGPVLADIFLGSIRNWDDPMIKEINPGQALPHLEITVVHRTEGKGSNYIFADFLSKASSKWRSQIGKTPSPAWPVGISANRGEDMMEKVKNTSGAIGYIELGFTITDNSVGVGHVQNASGKFVGASQASIANAYRSAEKSIPADFRASLTNVSGNDAYPIVSFTWLYVPEKSSDPERSRALAHFLEWALSMGEQSAEQHGYTPLPASLTTKVLAKVHSLH